ncbi:Gfo/Idh/MocA family oxidoreductase [Niabella sp. CC-SYL272]|uniref:Gfo/Idh/MocA family protein n=1 Tax=Niabella agricola TaxID=2891571 RepID=UPI001F1A172F|nr:Gfo/Idh/MocA family oxidoreductase [Niabella agricola]MCF3108026.1 Gfo/Idh/MocA family oxidoreductase [Niabella agricola]
MLKQRTMDRKRFLRLSALTGIGLGIRSGASATQHKPFTQGKRIGIIGLDTSHAAAFVKSLNKQDPDPAFSGYRVVAAYPRGSNDIPTSVERIPGYTAEVQQYGVAIASSIADLLSKVDVVCLETNDGRLHMEQALPVLKAGKPLFIDKPMTASLKDAVAIFKAADQYKVPVFSSSSLRYITGMDEILKGTYGKVIGAQTYSPAPWRKRTRTCSGMASTALKYFLLPWAQVVSRSYGCTRLKPMLWPASGTTDVSVASGARAVENRNTAVPFLQRTKLLPWAVSKDTIRY